LGEGPTLGALALTLTLIHPSSAWKRCSQKYAYPRSHTTHPQSMYPGDVQCPEGKIVVGKKTMQLLKAMRRQLGDTSASRIVDAKAAADSLGMDSDTHEFARRVQDLVRAGYLEPNPNSSSAPTRQGIYAADNH
jgi:hypothetical protein